MYRKLYIGECVNELVTSKMKFNKPYFYFWTTAILILIIGLIIFDSESAFDINLHDTYYVINHFVLTELIAFILIFAGLLYWIYEKANRKLNIVLTKIHLITTIGGILAYPLLIEISSRFFTDTSLILNILSAIIILIVVFAQFSFFINLIIGLLKTNKKPVHNTSNPPSTPK